MQISLKELNQKFNSENLKPSINLVMEAKLLANEERLQILTEKISKIDEISKEVKEIKL